MATIKFPFNFLYTLPEPFVYLKAFYERLHRFSLLVFHMYGRLIYVNLLNKIVNLLNFINFVNLLNKSYYNF